MGDCWECIGMKPGMRWAGVAGRACSVLACLAVCLCGCEKAAYRMIDKSGREASAGRSEWTRPFAEGLAKHGVDAGPLEAMEHGLAEVLFPEYAWDGRDLPWPRPYWNRTEWAYVDEAGRPVIKGAYFWCEPFSDGLATVRPKELPDGTPNTERLAGYIDVSGAYVVPPTYAVAGPFCEGLARVGAEGAVGYIAKDGSVAIPLEYADGSDFGEGVAAVATSAGGGIQWRYIDAEGKTALELPAHVAWAGRFSKGLAPASVPQREPSCGSRDAVYRTCVGFIDKSGTFVIEPRFDWAEPFSDGMAAVQINGRWGYVDRQGALVVPPRYPLAFPFHEGKALVCLR